MSPKMGVNPDQIKSIEPQPAGWYKLKLIGFKPTRGKKDTNSVNYNAQFEILNRAKTEDNFTKIVFATMSTKMAKHINDISHGLGFPLEPDGELVGSWVFDPKEPENVEKAQYKGPLIGRTMEAELAETEYQGNKRNEIRQVRCAVQGCAQKFPDTKHQTNMIGKK